MHFLQDSLVSPDGWLSARLDPRSGLCIPVGSTPQRARRVSGTLQHPRAAEAPAVKQP
jgi:hypothetical protein